jgi:hypothetical protein
LPACAEVFCWDGDRARVVPSTNNGRRVLNQEATS